MLKRTVGKILLLRFVAGKPATKPEAVLSKPVRSTKEITLSWTTLDFIAAAVLITSLRALSQGTLIGSDSHPDTKE
jgi:hypothetical protein